MGGGSEHLVLFENHRVRVWRLTLDPGSAADVAYQCDHVLFFPAAATLASGGPSAQRSYAEGEVVWIEGATAGEGAPVSNPGVGPAVRFAVELLDRPASGPGRGRQDNHERLAELDGAPRSPWIGSELPPEPATEEEVTDEISPEVVFENEVVKVWRSTMAPGESFHWHRHRHDYLYVYTTPGLMEARIIGVEELFSAPWDTGFVYYTEVGRAGQVPHALRNAGDEPATHYTVEILGPSRSKHEEPGEHNARTISGIRPLDVGAVHAAARDRGL